MTQDQAIKLMMLEMKVELEIESKCAIPEVFHSAIRTKLERMFAVGFDYGRAYFGGKGLKIVQFNSDRQKIAEFESQIEASKKVHYTHRAILRALKTGKKTRAGHYWKYAEEVTN